MTSSTPTPKIEAQGQATSDGSGQGAWWREWLKPVVVVAVVSLLVGGITLVTNVWVGSFESLRADIKDGNARLVEEIRATDTRLSEEIKASEDRANQRIEEAKEQIRATDARLGEEIRSSEVRVRDELKASETRQAQRTDQLRTDVKALGTDNRPLGKK